MLPPKQTQKRSVAVNVRFSGTEYERLKRIADYRNLSVTALVHHVVGNYLLPRMEREVQKEIRQTKPSATNAGTPDWTMFTAEDDPQTL